MIKKSINRIKHYWKEGIYKFLAFMIAYPGQGLIRLVLSTCKWKVEGLDNFRQIASKNRCILALWHNRLGIAAPVLHRYANDFTYAALISRSRDGELLSAVVNSYKSGRTIRVAHNNRAQALIDIVYHINELNHIVIITPDGPRGPIYQVKPGIAWAAIESKAYIVPFEWSSDNFWELKTWDKLRLPKPFSTIAVNFGEACQFNNENTDKEAVINWLSNNLTK